MEYTWGWAYAFLSSNFIYFYLSFAQYFAPSCSILLKVYIEIWLFNTVNNDRICKYVCVNLHNMDKYYWINFVSYWRYIALRIWCTECPIWVRILILLNLIGNIKHKTNISVEPSALSYVHCYIFHFKGRGTCKKSFSNSCLK